MADRAADPEEGDTCFTASAPQPPPPASPAASALADAATSRKQPARPPPPPSRPSTTSAQPPRTPPLRLAAALHAHAHAEDRLIAEDHLNAEEHNHDSIMASAMDASASMAQVSLSALESAGSAMTEHLSELQQRIGEYQSWLEDKFAMLQTDWISEKVRCVCVAHL